MDKNYKILFVGDLSLIGRTKQRYDALKEIGYTIHPISFVSIGEKPGISKKKSLVSRVFNKLGIPLDKLKINKKITKYIKTNKIDILWVEKALMLKPKTLKNIKKNLKIIFISEDDMYAKHNQSYYFKKCIPYFDIMFTSKSYNCNNNELYSLGAKKVEFFFQCYDKNLHKPTILTKEEYRKYKSDVCFVGTFEKDRADKLLDIANAGIEVNVWGNNWGKYVNIHPNLIIKNRPLYNDEYVKAICASKINLCFLRKINRDLHTSRSIEIPACGGFMLAERTDEHLKLFEEDKEAVFFDINDSKELISKINYYLSHNKERLKIAKAGRSRCIVSGYDHKRTLHQIFNKINNIFMYNGSSTF